MTDAERIAQLEKERFNWLMTVNYLNILLADLEDNDLLDFSSVPHEIAEGMEVTLMFVREGIKATLQRTRFSHFEQACTGGA